jgi:hypothetical protein
MPFVPSSQEGRPWRQRWRRRLLGSQQLRRRLFKRPARDVQRNVLELRPRGPGPLPPQRREAGLLQRLLHQPAKFEQPLLLSRDDTRKGARAFGLLFDSWSSRAGARPAPHLLAQGRAPRRTRLTWPSPHRRHGLRASCQMPTRAARGENIAAMAARRLGAAQHQLPSCQMQTSRARNLHWGQDRAVVRADRAAGRAEPDPKRHLREIPSRVLSPLEYGRIARQQRADRAAPTCGTGDPVSPSTSHGPGRSGCTPAFDPSCSGGPVPGVWPRCP